MCPDRQILSLYADSELPSPWKEKLEKHLDSCRICRSELESFQKLRSILLETSQNDEKNLKTAQERVWQRLETRKSRENNLVFAIRRNSSAWNRRISLPFPAAAAAAAVFVIVSFLALRSFITVKPGDHQYDIASGIGVDLEGIIPAADNLAGILQYLSSQESGNYMIIQLPESRNFYSYGEPALVRAADYNGRTNREPRNADRQELRLRQFPQETFISPAENQPVNE